VENALWQDKNKKTLSVSEFLEAWKPFGVGEQAKRGLKFERGTA